MAPRLLAAVRCCGLFFGLLFLHFRLPRYQTVTEINKGCYSFSSEEAVVDLERFNAISSEFHHCFHLLHRRLVSSRFTTWPYRFGYCRRRFCGAHYGIIHAEFNIFTFITYLSMAIFI